MTNTVLSALGLTLGYAEQSLLLSSVDLHLPPVPMALVGRNGVGKSTLLRCLAKHLTPQSGHITATVPIAYLAQTERDAAPAMTVEEWLGVAPALAALDRLLAGNGSADDLLVLNDRWTLREDVEAQCAAYGLPTSILAQPMRSLSGGQRTRLALCRLNPSPETFLLLDEPTNHLDRAGRTWFYDWLFQHPGGALVASHDQDLLHRMTHIIELRSGSVFTYGSGWEGYLVSRQQEVARAEADKAHALRTLKHEARQLQEARERHARRERQGRKKAAQGDAPKILLGMMKARSEATGGRLKAQQQDAMEKEQARVRRAQDRLEIFDPLHFALSQPAERAGNLLLAQDLVLPYVQRAVSLQVDRGERWLIQGPNASGKSVLLQVLHKTLNPASGAVQGHYRSVLLDQHLALLCPHEPAIAAFQRLNPGWTEQAYRDSLALMRLRRERALLPIQELSGGERLKLALASVLMGPTTFDLVLLDEPDNHLDLESQHLLASTLSAFKGTLMVVTHSTQMAEALRVDQRLTF
ncbi:ATP-binding cassette domain-containing protein [Salinispirillum marinum]|uniref:ATP-binding cassette domain-containing protein n=2 Tax=Saccharospirillaceae TaxID=255527 RepID=A0ABV8BH42_9GAMM